MRPPYKLKIKIKENQMCENQYSFFKYPFYLHSIQKKKKNEEVKLCTTDQIIRLLELIDHAFF